MARHTVNREQAFNQRAVCALSQENGKSWWCSSVVEFLLSQDEPLDSLPSVLPPPQEENITTTNLTQKSS